MILNDIKAYVISACKVFYNYTKVLGHYPLVVADIVYGNNSSTVNKYSHFIFIVLDEKIKYC